MTTQPKSGYAPVNGLEMYYEIHGRGRPIILIHGGFGSMAMFPVLVPILAEHRQVIGVELQGHGHTADIDRPFSYEQLADDVAALMDHLNLEKADLLGYSFGGEIAQQVVFRHPEKVDRLILMSVPHKHTGWYPEVQQNMGNIQAEFMMQTPLYDAYASVAPNPDAFKSLVKKSQALMSQGYDWSEELAQVTAPTLLILGDQDSMPLSFVAEMYALLGGGLQDGSSAVFGGTLTKFPNQLAVLPGTHHVDILFKPELLKATIVPFLTADVTAFNDSPMKETT